MRCLLVLLALCTGCIIVPKTTTTERVVNVGVTEKPGEPGTFALDMSRVGRTVTVKLEAPRVCLAESYNMVETTTSTNAGIETSDGGLGGGGGGAEGVLFGLAIIGVFEMVAVPVSGIVTGVIVAASDDKKTTARRVTAKRTHACPVPATHVAIGLEVPTGEVLTGHTDDHGIAVFELPVEAPLTGVVVAHAEGVGPGYFRY